MEDMGSPLSTLTCEEDITQLDDDDDVAHHEYDVFMQEPEAQDDYIHMLLLQECSYNDHRSYIAAPTRSDSVQWILRMKLCFGFGAPTAYLAVSYFDRFLALRSIDDGKTWAWRLLAVACLSLAAKMEELSVPALPEFRIEEYNFDSATILRMELMVLSTLEWRMNLVTPFAYLGYFAFKLEAGVEVELFSRAICFIFAVVRVMNVVDCRPSIIAAAAVLAASNQVLTKNLVESKINILSLPETLETEDVFLCYNLMLEESEKETLRPRTQVLVSSSVNSSVEVNEPTPFTAPTFKRRRLQ